jgi:hypothetical protein
VQRVLEIRAASSQPSNTVVAEEGSHLFQQHRDWFRQTAQATTAIDRVTFGGGVAGRVRPMARTPLQQHLALFETMRRKWGCTYFKLDANFGAPPAVGSDPHATRIEVPARHAGDSQGAATFLLVQSPIWPSAAGPRIAELERHPADMDRIASTARQNLTGTGTTVCGGTTGYRAPGPLTDEEARFTPPPCCDGRHAAWR